MDESIHDLIQAERAALSDQRAYRAKANDLIAEATTLIKMADDRAADAAKARAKLARIMQLSAVAGAFWL